MWSNLDKNTRLGMIAAISVLLILTIIVLAWIFSYNNSILFSNLDDKEASSVILALEDMKVPYELSEGGKNISVNESVVEEVRLKLIGKGVRIQSGSGFELFDNADIGMTEYSQKINYLRAMQGELERSVMSIDGIKYARVHLVLPETSVFKQKKQTPTASVTIIPEPEIVLSSDQISGIQRMIAAATPGITRDNVTILDNHGITLSKTDNEIDKEQITSMLLKKKKEAELYLENKVNTILIRTFGHGNTVTTISVDLVVDKIHRKEEIVLPQNSKSDGLFRKRESNTGDKKNNTKNKNKSIEVEYQLSKRIEEIISMPGAISRITVGVIVPEHVSSEQVNNIRNIISMAVGIDFKRGDGVEIYPMKIGLIEKVKSKKSLPLPITVDKSEGVKAVDEDIKITDNLKNIVSYENLIYLTSGLIIFLLFFIIFNIKNAIRKSDITHYDISIKEKEKLLSDIKSWVKEGAI